MTTPTNLICLPKPNGERYLFLFDDKPESLAALQRTCGEMAADPELGFSWFDAAIMAQAAGNIARSNA